MNMELNMLHTRTINNNEYDTLYTQMQRDFPEGEIAPSFVIKRNLENGKYKGFYFVNTTTDQHNDTAANYPTTDIGYAILSAPEGIPYVLINYFAIFPEYRSKGYGSKVLAIIRTQYPDRHFVIEADDPSAAEGEERRNQALRRIRFYERAGFRVIPTQKANIFGVDMLIMTTAADDGLSAREIMHGLYSPTLDAEWLRNIDVVDKKIIL
jgi:GNAT superfamily N-acetyltransferase